MTLTDFLLARIAEDEVAAREALALHGSGTDYPRGHPLDPARVLAECEAKRRIIEEHAVGRSGLEGALWCSTCAVWDEVDFDGPPEVAWPCPTLRALALPYIGHPEFQEEWLSDMNQS